MNLSLRLRLVLIILLPLLLIAAILSLWAFRDAQIRATERFDLSLLSAALAVSRDVAVSGGDALSPETNALLRDTSGGNVFYHVYAPDGVFVTGYATPPVPVGISGDEAGQQVFQGTHQGEKVRALRFVDVMELDGLSGTFTVTVWQETGLLNAVVRDLSRQTFLVMAFLVATVGLVVWFGVRLGLRPLLNLETAIAARSSDELAPIRRKVPIEAQGIVRRLNGLLGQVSTAMNAKDVFISNAAHQLRNPIAGISAMVDAVQSAKTFDDMKDRTKALAVASRQATDLANKLLTLERAKGQVAAFDDIKAADFLAQLDRKVSLVRASATQVTYGETTPDIMIHGDLTLLLEAAANIVDNALHHGGAHLSRVDVTVRADQAGVWITVTDDGQGMAAEDIEDAKERFVQLEPSDGSGLGLAIADTIAAHHGGRLDIQPLTPGVKVALCIPHKPPQSAFADR